MQDQSIVLGHIKVKTKDLAFKAKARTKDHNFVLKDNHGPRTKAKDNNSAYNAHLTGPLYSLPNKQTKKQKNNKKAVLSQR